MKTAAKTEGAHIVNLASLSAFIGLPSQTSYSLTKAGIQMLSESLWIELYDDNVGVTSVHPGAIKTDMMKATLAESDNLKIAERNFRMAQKMGVTPEYACKRIIKAIERNKSRVRIGLDAILTEWLKRLLPKFALRPLVWAYRTTRH